MAAFLDDYPVTESPRSKQHTIPLRSLVEVIQKGDSYGVRGFVVMVGLDDDKRPLYGISTDLGLADTLADLVRQIETLPKSRRHENVTALHRYHSDKVSWGWTEESLTIVARPQKSSAIQVERLFNALNQFPVLAGRLTRRQCELALRVLTADGDAPTSLTVEVGKFYIDDHGHTHYMRCGDGSGTVLHRIYSDQECTFSTSGELLSGSVKYGDIIAELKS